PDVTWAPAGGDCETTAAAASAIAPAAYDTSPTASPTWRSRIVASDSGRPTTSGTITVVGPALSTSATAVGIGACVPGRGRESITAPRGSLLGCSVTSPASNPAASSAVSASSRLMPMTPGTVAYFWPALTT